MHSPAGRKCKPHALRVEGTGWGRQLPLPPSHAGRMGSRELHARRPLVAPRAPPCSWPGPCDSFQKPFGHYMHGLMGSLLGTGPFLQLAGTTGGCGPTSLAGGAQTQRSVTPQSGRAAARHPGLSHCQPRHHRRSARVSRPRYTCICCQWLPEAGTMSAACDPPNTWGCVTRGHTHGQPLPQQGPDSFSLEGADSSVLP